jgi:hypothetical protein
VALLGKPLLSNQASGKLGSEIQFAHSKGRAIAGRRRYPRQPRTLAQRAPRLFIPGIARLWSTLTTAQKLSWEPLADELNLPLYHAYLKHNANRYKNLNGNGFGHTGEPFYPLAIYPADYSTDYCWAYTISMTGLSLAADHKFEIWDLLDNFVFTWHLSTPSEFWPTYTNLVHVWQPPAIGIHTVRIPNLPAGPKVLRLVRTSRTGKCADTSLNFPVTILP